MSKFGKIYQFCGDYSRILKVHRKINWVKNKYLLSVNKIELSKNKNIKVNQKESECYIITSGASIQSYDLKLLRNKFTIANNTLHKHHDYKKLNINWFYISAPAFSISYEQSKNYYVSKYIDNEKDFNRWIVPNVRCSTFCKKPIESFPEVDSMIDPQTNIMTNIMSKKYIEKNNLFLDNRVNYFLRSDIDSSVVHSTDIDSASSQMEKIKIDHTDLMVVPNGSLLGIIFFATYLGFKKIFLLGNDYCCDPVLLLHYYDSPRFTKKHGSKWAINMMNKFAKNRNADIFSITEDEEYYTPIFSTDTASLGKKHWQNNLITDQYCKSKNVTIYNVVPKGVKSYVYKNIFWEDLPIF